MSSLVNKPVGPVGYGMMNLTWREDPIPDEQAFATLKAALESGTNLWNGGTFYGKPETNSLQLLKRYFTKYPEDADKVILSIKGSAIIGPGGMPKISGTKEVITGDIDAALKVLEGKKTIDIFEMAREDPETPLEESAETLLQCVKEKKIGGIGLSEVTADQIKAHAALHPIAAVEVELSLQTPDVLDNGVTAICGELGIPIVAYSPLGRGLLTSAITTLDDLDKNDIRRHLPRFSPENIAKNIALRDELQKIAKTKACTEAQVAIAWVKYLSGRPGFPTVIPIPGSTTEARARENSKVPTLSNEEFQEIEEIRKRNAAVGARYPKHME